MLKIQSKFKSRIKLCIKKYLIDRIKSPSFSSKKEWKILEIQEQGDHVEKTQSESQGKGQIGSFTTDLNCKQWLNLSTRPSLFLF